MSHDINSEYYKGFEKYGRKWYVRHDCNPEMIPDSWDKLHFDYMKKLGNVFDTREQAYLAGQLLRHEFMNIMIARAINNNTEIAKEIFNAISRVDNS